MGMIKNNYYYYLESQEQDQEPVTEALQLTKWKPELSEEEYNKALIAEYAALKEGSK